MQHWGETPRQGNFQHEKKGIWGSRAGGESCHWPRKLQGQGEVLAKSLLSLEKHLKVQADVCVEGCVEGCRCVWRGADPFRSEPGARTRSYAQLSSNLTRTKARIRSPDFQTLLLSGPCFPRANHCIPWSHLSTAHSLWRVNSESQTTSEMPALLELLSQTFRITC